MELFDSQRGPRTNSEKFRLSTEEVANDRLLEKAPLIVGSQLKSDNLTFGISAILAGILATLTAICWCLETILQESLMQGEGNASYTVKYCQTLMVIALTIFGLACARNHSKNSYLKLGLKSATIVGLVATSVMIRSTLFADPETSIQPAEVIASFSSDYVARLCKTQKRALLTESANDTVTQCARILISRASDILGVITATHFLLCYIFILGVAFYLFRLLAISKVNSKPYQLMAIAVAVICSIVGYKAGHQNSNSLCKGRYVKLPSSARFEDCTISPNTSENYYRCTIFFLSSKKATKSFPQPAIVRISSQIEAGVALPCHDTVGTAYLPESVKVYSLTACRLQKFQTSVVSTSSPSHLAGEPQPQSAGASSTSTSTVITAKPPTKPKLPPLSADEQKQLTALSQDSLNYLLLVFREQLFSESSGIEIVPVGDEIPEVSRNVTLGGRMFILDSRKYLKLAKDNDPLVKLLTPADLAEVPKGAVEKISDAVAKQTTAGSHSSLNFEKSELKKLDSLGYYRIVVNARKSPPLIKADEEMSSKYTQSFGKEDWKTKIQFDESVLSQITDDGELIDGVQYGYHHGIHRNADNGAIVFNCVGKYNNATKTCDGRISGSVRKCHFSDDNQGTKVCDTLIYLRDYGQGEGTLKSSLFSGEMVYPVPLSDYNTVRVNCTGKYDGFGCIGSLKFEIDIDKFNGYGTCEKGIYLHYCLGGLNMYYGNLGLGDAASSDVDGYQVLCEGIYNFKKRTCTKNFQKSACVGDMLGNSKSFSCAGQFKQRKCDLLMIGGICGPKKVVCSKMLTDGKCLSFESSTDELCTGYTVTNADKSVDCVGKYKVKVTEEEVTKKIGECEGTMKIAKKQCDGKFVKENKAVCRGLMTTQTLCEGRYEDLLDNINVICIGKYLEKTDQCNGTQSLNFKSESTKICDGVSPLKTPDTCDGVISVSTRTKLYGANSFKGNLLVSRSQQKDSFSCKGVVMMYPHADKFFCSGDLRYTPDPTTPGKKFRCRIWDKDKCIPDNPHSKGIITANV